MPAAAVIPAPIAYIKVVAVKKLVVEFWGRGGRSAVSVCTASPGSFSWGTIEAFRRLGREPGCLP